MDVESPEHLERLRDQPEIKAALLRQTINRDTSEARFERAAKNALYWPPIEALSQRFIATGHVEETRESCTLYARPCWLIATRAVDSPNAPYVIAIAAADGAAADTLAALLQRVNDDYWFGSYFFK